MIRANVKKGEQNNKPKGVQYTGAGISIHNLSVVCLSSQYIDKVGITFKWQKVQVDAASDAAGRAQHFYGKLTTPNVSGLRFR